ncbi:MAG: hypothetical protein H0U27_10465 [Nitrosopumilus sp.]|nr:hypothetical protein [Nitrosopumilus sp.]
MKVHSRFLSIFLFLAFCFGIGAHLQVEAGSKIGKIKNTSWIDSQENDGIVYFLFDSPSRIERYSLDKEAFLNSIPLFDIPTAFTLDSEGLYVSFDKRISYLSLDGFEETPLYDISSKVDRLFTLNEFLYLQQGQTLTSINKYSGKGIASREYWYSMNGISVSKKKEKIFARTNGISPSDILQISMNVNGSLGHQKDSPYHGTYPNASKTYLFPNEERVVDSSGIIYSTTDLTYSANIAGKFDDIAFHEDLPIVLRGNTLISYSNALLKTGEYVLRKRPLSMYVEGEYIYTFYISSKNKLRVKRIPFSWLKTKQPGEPVNPTDLAYNPDVVQISDNGVVHLLSKDNLSIFRWSIFEKCYLETIPLVSAPSHMTYSSINNTIYLAYQNGELTQIALNSSTVEFPFANSPGKPLGITAVGNYLFVCDPTGAWVSHFIYDFDGNLISEKDWNYYSSEYIWSEENQKIYFLRDGTSPNNLHSEEIKSDGTIGVQNQTPYHGIEGIKHPIRVSHDGSTVILGSGLIFDALNLTLIGSLPNSITDAVWIGDALYTLQSDEDKNSQIQKWDSNYHLVATQKLLGKPINIFSVFNCMFVVSELSGKPNFTLLHIEFSNLLYNPIF